MKKTIVVLFTIVSFYHNALSQISGYGSVSFGQSTNPLYDYQKISDQFFQTYLEVNSDRQFETSELKFQYVGGSMIFHRLALRNYYEHRLAAGFDTQLFPLPKLSENDENDSDGEVQHDSIGAYFHTDFQIGARHDKKEFQEFNNYGFVWNNALRFSADSELVVRITNGMQYRYYPYLTPFQNLSEIFSINLEKNTKKKFQYGGSISIGCKYFPSITYDTSLFEETRSYSVQTGIDSILVGNGQQQHWQQYTYFDSTASDKIVLKNPGTKTAYQVALGGYIQQNWNTGSLRAEIIYRINAHSTLLTIVQNTSTRTLNEDLYNNVFNAYGPELHGIIKYLLPYNIQFVSNIDIEHNTFETPSYNLISGDIIKNNRIDILTNFEIYVSKFFQINDGFGFDVSVSSNYLRNQSDDAYNDYSVLGFAISIGCSL